MKRFKGSRGAFFFFLCAVIVLVGYYSVSMRGNRNEPEGVEMTPIQNVLSRDLGRNYPQTPKELIKYYSEITMCFYNEECTDKELEQLAMRAKELYDAELAANKDDEAYLKDLKSEIAVFQLGDNAISSYVTSSSTDVDYFTHEGHECARLYCTYNIRSGTVFQTVEQVFVLRKDENQHWKIFGWDKAEDARSSVEE